jgi:hypothetical protein
VGVAPEMVERFAGLGEAQISAAMSDRIARAFLLDDDVRPMALDFNARLVTMLREAAVWPARYQATMPKL